MNTNNTKIYGDILQSLLVIDVYGRVSCHKQITPLKIGVPTKTVSNAIFTLFKLLYGKKNKDRMNS